MGAAGQQVLPADLPRAEPSPQRDAGRRQAHRRGRQPDERQREDGEQRGQDQELGVVRQPDPVGVGHALVRHHVAGLHHERARRQAGEHRRAGHHERRGVRGALERRGGAQAARDNHR